MRRRLATACLLAATLILSSQIQGGHRVTAAGAPFTGDPCNFTTSFGFGYDQVLACFRSVPFCPDPDNPASCDRDAQVAHLRAAIEGFSDLRETYDQDGHWRRKLDAVATARFRTDYDFFLAMSDVMASFRNPHWNYLGPRCFEQTLFALIPLKFGSMVTKVAGGEQQMIYLREPNPFFDFRVCVGDRYRCDSLHGPARRVDQRRAGAAVPAPVGARRSSTRTSTTGST